MWYNKLGFSKEVGIDAKGFLVDKDKGVRNVTLKTGDQVIPHEGDSLNVFYPHPTKWGAYDETDDFGYAVVKDWPVMRLGETYLLRAEARFRQGNTQGAADDINVLRDRAFKDYRAVAPGAGKVTADQIDIDFILDERARELISEENRRMTLVRTNTLAERIKLNGDMEPAAPSNKVITGFDAIIFPGYFGNSTVNSHTINYHIGVNVETLFGLLTEQILAGLCFGQENSKNATDDNEPCRETASLLAARFISKLPELRRILATDVEAAYYGDPAATCFGEIISCYPAIRAISNYRIAHELLILGVPLIPRFITEMAHSETGIDIHPGAQIGHHFTIDHGTGVVIGATSIIGNNVKLYQGVTLGAKSFPLDNNGNPIKGIPRHPILEDDVIVYSNATILGRVTIGKGATVGGNIWVTENVPAGSRIVQRKNKDE